MPPEDLPELERRGLAALVRRFPSSIKGSASSATRSSSPGRCCSCSRSGTRACWPSSPAASACSSASSGRSSVGSAVGVWSGTTSTHGPAADAAWCRRTSGRRRRIGRPRRWVCTLGRARENTPMGLLRGPVPPFYPLCPTWAMLSPRSAARRRAMRHLPRCRRRRCVRDGEPVIFTEDALDFTALSRRVVTGQRPRVTGVDFEGVAVFARGFGEVAGAPCEAMGTLRRYRRVHPPGDVPRSLTCFVAWSHAYSRTSGRLEHTGAPDPAGHAATRGRDEAPSFNLAVERRPRPWYRQGRCSSSANARKRGPHDDAGRTPQE